MKPLAALLPFIGLAAFAQQAPVPDQPLPDVAALMLQVEANQKASEDLRKRYIYTAEQQFEKVGKEGEQKKLKTIRNEVFWIDGIQVTRKLAEDGKPLTPDEARKENERIDKEVAKIRDRREKRSAEGKPARDQGDFILPIARYLQLGTFSNPRRELLDARQTIVIDYAGNPDAKTNNPTEAIAKDLAGTLYIDEQDRVVQHFDAHFVRPFRLALGLVSIGQGLNFTVRNVKINNEVWLQQSIDGNGHVRAFLFFAVDGNFHLRNSDYRKFTATSKILPGFTEVPETPDPK